MIPGKKNIWIFGGTGFIGKALVNYLSANEQNLLHLLVHKHVPYRHLEAFNTITGSLSNFDLTWLERYPPDIIFHLARLGGRNALTRYWASREGARANQRIIDYLSGLNSPPIVVYVSGSLMYGHQPANTLIDESAGLAPISYARYYIRGERPWIAAQEKQIIDVRFARPGWIVGPGSWFSAFYWNYIKKNGKVPIYGEGQQLMSLIHWDDCAGQIVALATHGSKFQNLNIFSGSPITQSAFAETLAGMLNDKTEHISIQKLKHRYGKTIAEALTSSIPLTSSFKDVSASYTSQYPGAAEMLQKTISLLKYNQNVFPKTP